MPKRTPEESVTFSKCAPNEACVDKDNFKKIIANKINTESYIRQLLNLIGTLSDPVL